jgi:cytoskeletal protein CcmA (bactofilin family)
MWNKTREEGNAPRTQNFNEPPAAPAPAQAPPPPPHQPQQQQQRTVVSNNAKAVIGPSMQIKGEIRSNEELTVDGEVEGIVECGSLLSIGRNGKVRANIKAREVHIFGSVKGNIEALEKLAIRDQGSLVGDIKTAGISIDDGAYFKGSIDISRPEPKVSTKPVKTEAKAG